MLHLKIKYWLEGYALAMHPSSYDFIEGEFPNSGPDCDTCKYLEKIDYSY